MKNPVSRQPPARPVEIFLNPGEFHFGHRDTRIRTLLGSCVAITLWHPQLLIGGMCHYLLPSAGPGSSSAELDGRYADQAMLRFMRELARSGTRPEQYQVKLFGGGNQFPQLIQGAGGGKVPERNIEAGQRLLADYGFRLEAQHVGGTGHRTLLLELWSGHVWLRHVAGTASGGVA